MNAPRITRRRALQKAALGAAACGTFLTGGTALAARWGQSPSTPGEWFRISLAQWSLHKILFAGDMDHLDFAAEARGMGFDAIEYVNTFFKDKALDAGYLTEMKRRASDHGVTQLLIMCDGEGDLGDPDELARGKAVENHKKWLEAAARLGCHSIRVNAASQGTWDQQMDRAADGLRRLCELADPYGVNVLVENHGGLSSNGRWLAGVMSQVDHPRVGTLPDFGNFCMDWARVSEADAWYDRYQGVQELMPFAKALSAKSHQFDASGNEVRTDYTRMLRVVKDAGYRGWIGVEYEGDQLSPRAGSTATKKLLEKVRAEMP